MPGRQFRVKRRESGAPDAPPPKRSRSDWLIELAQPPGWIREITLQNFMCHEHLRLEFERPITFIEGQNGSGKSAVLTALVVGLGGRASHTDRGSSFRELIRTGQRQASISVTLDNTGEGAFASDRYGETITLERTLRLAGTSGYRVSDRTGKLCPAKKPAVKAILDAFNIHVDNPLVILTQEKSKNFLRVEDPVKKYKLFMNASRLSHITDWYNQVRKDQVLTRNAIEENEQALKQQEAKLRQLEQELNLHDNRDQMEKELEQLKLHLLWTEATEEEAKLEKAKRECNETKQKVEQIASRKEDFEKRLQQKEKNHQEKKSQLDKAHTQAKGERDKYNWEMHERSSQLRKMEEKIRDVENQRRDKKREKEITQAEIDRQRQESQPDYHAERQRRQQQLAELEAKLAELNAAEKTRSGHLQNVSGSVQRRVEELERKQEEVRAQRKEIADLERELRVCQTGGANPLSVFGAWVAAVEQDIDTAMKSRQFRKRPIGPVGAHIRIKAGCEEWKALVETCLVGVLHAYLVDDISDQRVLSGIIRKHTQQERVKPSVISSKFLGQVHDVGARGINTSTGEHVSVWSVLEIANPVVANAVIDQAGAEGVLLLRTEDEARAKLAYRDRVPRGCRRALTLAGFQYYPAPSYRTYPIGGGLPRARFLQVSVEEKIRELTRLTQESRAAAQSADSELAQLRAAREEGRQQEHEARQQLADARQQQRVVRGKLRELNSQEELEPVNLQALDEEVAQMDGIIAGLEESLPALEEEKRKIESLVKESQQGFQLADEMLQNSIAELQNLRSEKEDTGALQSDLDRLRAVLERAQGQRDRRLEEVSGREEAAQRAVSRARDATAGQRIHPEGLATELRSRIVGLERALQDEAQKPQRSQQEARREYDETQRLCMEGEERGKMHQEALKKLDGMIAKRQEFLKRLSYSLGNRITTHFDMVCRANNIPGEIIFQHVEKKLSIQMNPEQPGCSSDGERLKRTTTQLSGGERSFFTIAFLMAMWTVINSPFRLLDEYDVFMDEANRRFGQDLLISSTADISGQFTFFTPLSITGNFEGNDRVRILRMKNPNRQE